nr:probable inactive ATP-dependent zinc metalloprotease FTSHI 1, chloroplastic [Tanacetum cinerariifolium]
MAGKAKWNGVQLITILLTNLCQIFYRMVELGEVTATIAATVFVVVSGFLASVAFAVAVVHVGTVYGIWPIAKPFLTIRLVSFMVGFPQTLMSCIRLGCFLAFKIARPLLLIGVCIVILLCFSLSRRPKNFRKWVIWLGIEFSQSKPQARVAGLARVTFSDAAEIEIVTVEEL